MGALAAQISERSVQNGKQGTKRLAFENNLDDHP